MQHWRKGRSKLAIQRGKHAIEKHYAEQTDILYVKKYTIPGERVDIDDSVWLKCETCKGMWFANPDALMKAHFSFARGLFPEDSGHS